MKYETGSEGKFASRWRAKSPDALCAVLPKSFLMNSVALSKNLCKIVKKYLYFACSYAIIKVLTGRVGIPDVSVILDNTAQSPPDGFARHLLANFPSEPVSYLLARILRAYFPRYFGKILENPQRIFSVFPFISQKI